MPIRDIIHAWYNGTQVKHLGDDDDGASDELDLG